MSKSIPVTISDLSDDVLEGILAFVGTDLFRYVAATDRQFLRVYRHLCLRDFKNDVDNDDDDGKEAEDKEEGGFKFFRQWKALWNPSRDISSTTEKKWSNAPQTTTCGNLR
jgi:hypothetical protein